MPNNEVSDKGDLEIILREKIKETKKYYKNNSSKVNIITGALIVLIGGFYWFSIRPEQIRKECAKDNYSESSYRSCLRENGLEAEPYTETNPTIEIKSPTSSSNRRDIPTRK